ncbi:MAG: hypothetical protein LUI08_06210 [Prevotella sp.]|nr:hypothetical protein [Prevotella sp.]
MNRIFKYSVSLILCLPFFAGCSPEKFDGADESGLPTVSGRSIVVDVDQETNTATFSITGDLTGCYPAWYLDGSESSYSILPTASYTSMDAGEHTVSVRLMNRNGQSQAALEASFTFNETKTDYSVYFSRLCDKEWRVDYSEAGHMGCGESGSDGSNWWSAGVNEKADFGVYDNRMSFTHTDADASASGTYYFDPGASGTVYVNEGCSLLGFNPDEVTEDITVAAEAQSSVFSLETGSFNGDDCLYIQFASKAWLPYIPNDDTYLNPYYRIESLTNTRLAIVCDNGEIAWRMVLTSREDTGLPEEEGETMDWDASASTNLWKAVEDGSAFNGTYLWFADDGWAQLPDPDWSHDGTTWQITLPEGMGGSQWQGQFHIYTTLSATAGKAYNFYMTMDADNDMSDVTIKLTDADNDANYFFTDRHNITAGQTFVYKAEGVTLAGDAGALNLVFDFAGAPAGTVVNIDNIYFEEAVSYDDDSNLWKAVDDGSAFNYVSEWFADDGWAEIDVADYTFADGVWTIVLPDNMGGTQWQGQFQIHTTIPALITDSYTFSCTVEPDNDLSQMTIKLTDDADDGNYFFDGRHDFAADKATVYKATGAALSSGNADALTLVLDFGGSPGGTTVKIYDIILMKEN